MKELELQTRNEDKKSMLEDILKQVLKKTVHPQDYYEIAAILESFGWNDTRASELFGVEDVFELAMIIWDMIRERVGFQPFAEEKKIGFFEHLVIMIKSFLRGLIFAMPMAISVVSMLTLRFSLWSYKNLSTDKATAIAFGTILSFMSIGGFTQAIARRGFFYISQGFYNMAKRITYTLVKLGYLFCIFIALIYLIFNWIFPVFDFSMIWMTFAFYMFLSSNWLAVTVMYILEKEFTFTALITAGIGVVFILFRVFKFDIILSQIIALIFISVLGVILVVYFFNQAERKMEKGIAPTSPKRSIVLYSLMPYFKYGLMYFTFLFVDRVISWSTDGASMPYLIWFRGDYELGLDFALLMLIVPMGFGEVVVTKLMENLEAIQKNSLNHEIGDVSSKSVAQYINSILMVTISALISAVVVYASVMYIKNGNTTISQELIFSNITYFVFIIGLISYLVLCIALTNAVILFSLSQPEMVTKIMYLATGVNFIIGFILTRWFGHKYAVIGLLAGAVVFAALTSRNVVKVMRNLDYYIYAGL